MGNLQRVKVEIYSVLSFSIDITNTHVSGT